MPEIIQIPPFPKLTWTSGCWEGECRLPSWAGFQSRTYRAVQQKTPVSDGTARLIIDLPKKSPPTAEQIAAFQHLVDNETTVADAIQHALFAIYPDEREAYLDAYDIEESEDVPEISELSDLRTLVELHSVFVLDVARDGVACIGFQFRCVWEEEHGAGIMTHHGKVIAMGQADTAFSNWEAKEGLDKK